MYNNSPDVAQMLGTLAKQMKDISARLSALEARDARRGGQESGQAFNNPRNRELALTKQVKELVLAETKSIRTEMRNHQVRTDKTLDAHATALADLNIDSHEAVNEYIASLSGNDTHYALGDSGSSGSNGPGFQVFQRY